LEFVLKRGWSLIRKRERTLRGTQRPACHRRKGACDRGDLPFIFSQVAYLWWVGSYQVRSLICPVTPTHPTQVICHLELQLRGDLSSLFRPNQKFEIATPPFRRSKLAVAKHRGFAMTNALSHRALWVSRAHGPIL
jgi:hypothetical protein